MREDYDEIGHYVRSLSRILLLIAVIIAVPLILSTITAFVRNQSNVSTIHDLVATASVNAYWPSPRPIEASALRTSATTRA